MLCCVSFHGSGIHPGGAAESHRDALRPHLPAEEQVPGDHRLLPELHRGGGRRRGHLLLRPDGHPTPRQPNGKALVLSFRVISYSLLCMAGCL